MAMSRNKRGNWGGWVAAALIALAIYTSETDKPVADSPDGGQQTEELASIEQN